MKEVVVAIIRHSVEDKWLMVSSTEDHGEFTGLLYPPGGKREPGETKPQTLTRESKEELDIEIKPIREIAQTPGDVEDQITYWWECEIVSGTPRIVSDEIAEVGWFSREEMDRRGVWPATESFFQEYIDAPKVRIERES